MLVENARALDIRQICRAGLMRRGGPPAVGWNDGIVVATMAGHVEGCQDVAVALGKSERVIEVRLVSTPCHLGGRCWWWLCPYCHSRRGILYAARGTLACRRCLGLTYLTQRLRPAERLLERQARICSRWGVCPEELPDKKPPRMHRRTYEALLGRLDNLENRRLAAILGGTRFAGLMARTG